MKLGFTIFSFHKFHSSMYGKGNIQVLEGVIELQTRLIFFT